MDILNTDSGFHAQSANREPVITSVNLLNGLLKPSELPEPDRNEFGWWAGRVVAQFASWLRSTPEGCLRSFTRCFGRSSC